MALGYYDQDYENRYRPPKQKKGGSFFSGLIGAIVGAIIVLLALPQLSELNILPYTVQPDNENTNINTNEPGNVPTQNVSVDVTTDITEAVDKTADAVVGITNLQSTSFWSNGENQPIGTGSGVIYKKEGDSAFIVTNQHVVDSAQQLEVTLSDGTKLPAELLGEDIWTDLAVLEVSSENIKTVAEFGNSDQLKPGEPVIAIGNPLGLEFSGSVTNGIISGVERTIPIDLNGDQVEDWQVEVLQTDAAINPGNSGGALVNIAGQVVGINSMKIAQSAVEGIGLSIPINTVSPIINDLELHGEVIRPVMGVTLRNLNEIAAYHQQETLKLPSDVKEGVVIESVEPNTPAARAGLSEMDVIIEMDGEKIADVIALRKHLYNEKQVGDQMRVKFYRQGEVQEVTLNLSQEGI
ncbi:trypsin-like peptidase domain-containing protein [Bacillaceae bacterium Marseille-Q3522]|nr:trypsin-like peptidase domain-containing protein [Bacillaceae bacterium Marseille-Q3522]